MFGVQTANGVYVGATTYISNTNTQLTVTAVSGTTITVTPAFPVGGFSVGSNITFTNPQFTTQPTLATLRTTPVTTLTGTTSDMPGQIYATTQSLYVSFTDRNEGIENWFKVTSDKVNMVTQATATNNTTLATTEFVHNVLPYGSIIMWYGDTTNVPSGWSLCNGSGDTPDLRDRFVIAAGPIYAVDSTGGSTSTSVSGSHDHTGITSTASITVPNTGWPASGVPSTNGVLLAGSGNAEIGEYLESVSQTTASLEIGTHAHNIASSGTHIHTVIPPYYALCYIMKVVG
jgi:hypothetical protein